ncbi:MAG: hypothetical protein RLZZ458_21 [Planctomycetota bacterium]|jgi:hypothetical protein
MPFEAGELCCSSSACVLLDTNTGSGTTWDKIPHVTQISVNQTANTPKLVTSSTGGKETSACGTVTQTGNLAVACHRGVGPGYLTVNNVYRIRWAEDCTYIWNAETCAAFSDGDAANYLDAYIRITTVPIDFNISGNAATIYNYSFDIVGWVVSPETYQQAPQTDVDAGFLC